MKRYKYNVLVEWETGEKTYKPLSALAADALATCDTNTIEHDLLPIEGCQRFKNLAKRDKHDLSSLASPKGEMESSFSWTNLFKSPTSSTLCFGEPTLRKLNQVKLLCSSTPNTLCDSTLGIHPTGHSISEVDWVGCDPSPNHMNEFLFSEVDWGAHDSSLFLFLVNIDYDAKAKEPSIQGLWGELQQRTSSIPLIELLIDLLATGQIEDNIFNSIPIDPDLDDSEKPTGESIQSYLTSVGHYNGQ